MTVVFPESPKFLDSFGDENRKCALSREPIEPPYMVWLVDRKKGPDFFVDGRSMTPENVLGHVRDALAGTGPWARIAPVHRDVIADLLALANARVGGLPNHSVIGQHRNAVDLPEGCRVPIGTGGGRKPRRVSSD